MDIVLSGGDSQLETLSTTPRVHCIQYIIVICQYLLMYTKFEVLAVSDTDWIMNLCAD